MFETIEFQFEGIRETLKTTVDLLLQLVEAMAERASNEPEVCFHHCLQCQTGNVVYSDKESIQKGISAKEKTRDSGDEETE